VLRGLASFSKMRIIPTTMTLFVILGFRIVFLLIIQVRLVAFDELALIKLVPWISSLELLFIPIVLLYIMNLGGRCRSNRMFMMVLHNMFFGLR
jgi:hypothetical protein